MRNAAALASLVWPLLLAELASAAVVTIPAGTRIFGELQAEVSSNAKVHEAGEFVPGRVWRNVVVDGQTVIAAGAPMVLQVSAIQKRRTFGRAGSIEVRAVSVVAVDGTEIFLEGGYDKKGEGRIVLSSTLAALVAWPTLFIKGKEVVLPPGTVFDAAIPANTNVAVADGPRPTIRLSNRTPLSVEILYDELTEDADELPVVASLCGRPWAGPFQIDRVNDGAVEPLAIQAGESRTEGDCQVTRGLVDLEELSEHLGKGINRLTVRVGDSSAEVILDVEM